MEPEVLATTALEATWGTSEKLLFAGDWCLKYSRTKAWSSRTYRTVPNVWVERAQKFADANELRSIRASVLSHLVVYLNEHHQVDYPSSYWRVIAEPWLSIFLSVALNRWNTVLASAEMARAKGAIVYRVPHIGAARPPIDTAEWLDAVTMSDYYNERLFTAALEVLGCPHIELRTLPWGVVVDANPKPRRASQTFRRMLKRIVGPIAKPLYRSCDTLVQHSLTGFSLLERLKLALSLGQLPDPLSVSTSVLAKYEPVATYATRARRPIRTTIDGPLGVYLCKTLAENVPSTLLEGYHDLRIACELVSARPRVICASTQFWLDDPFKVWAAQQRLLGARLIAVEHGGGLPPAEKCLDFEEETFDRVATWAKPTHVKHTQLPSTKIRYRRRSAHASNLLILGCDMPRFSYRLHAGPIGGQILRCADMWCTFIAALSPNVRATTRFRPYHVNYSDVQARLEHRFGQSLISAGDSYGKALHQGRLVVCTYPQTTFSEAAASGPTILLFDPTLWEVHNDFSDLLGMLSEAEIAHYDPVAAARFVDRCWPEIEDWWRSKKVAKACATFFRDACLIARRPAGPWGMFLQKERDAVVSKQSRPTATPSGKAQDG